MPLIRTGAFSLGGTGHRWDAEFFANSYDELLDKMFAASTGWVPLRHVAQKLTSGHTPLRHDLEEGDADFVTVECIDPLGIDLSKAKRVTTQHVEGELRRVSLTPGDVVVTIKRRIVNACPIDELERPTAVNQDVAVITPIPDFLPGYIAAVLCSRIGKFQAYKQQTEQINPYISVGSLGTLLVPLLESRDQRAVDSLVAQRLASLRLARARLREAQDALTVELGLNRVSSDEPKCFERRMSDVRAASRFDAQYYSPRFQAALAVLASGGNTVADICDLRKERFRLGGAPFRYVEISDVGADGKVASSEVAADDAPSRATWRVRSGDVVTSLVRPGRGISGVVPDEIDGAICSSGLAVLNPTRVPGEVLLVFLRHPLVTGILDLQASASMYPAVSAADILALPFPTLRAEASRRIQDLVQQSRSASRNADMLGAEAVTEVERLVMKWRS